jgi:predicted dehydrogenase
MNRLSVVGLGSMGYNHVRTINELHNAELSVVVDYNRLRAEEIARDFGAAAAIDIKDITPENTDGVIVASPSEIHAEMADELLRRGLNVLVEKPISLEISEGERLARVAKDSGRVLMVGHTELFNPAVREMDRIIGSTAIRSMRFKRLGTVKDQSRLYHNAVYDLMIHDIAVAFKLMDKTDDGARVLSAIGRMDTSAPPDPAEAYVRFDSGEDAHFRASRSYTGGKIRTLEIETQDYVIDANFINHRITQRSAGEGRFKVGEALFTQDAQEATYYPQRVAEPLALELSHFIDSIDGKTTPEKEYVSALDALRVMRLANAILEKIKNSD